MKRQTEKIIKGVSNKDHTIIAPFIIRYEENFSIEYCQN